MATLYPDFFGNYNPSMDPSTALNTLYQDYLGRAPDPSGMSTFSSALQGLTPGTQQYANTLGQIGMDLFNSAEGQKYAPTAPWYSAYQGGAWGYNPAGPGQVNVPTLAGGGTTMPATPQAVNAASTLGVPVNSITGAPINPPAPSAASAQGGSSAGGFDLSSLAPNTQGLGPSSGGFDINKLLSSLFTPSTMSPTTTAPAQTAKPATPAAPAQSPINVGGSGLPSGYLPMIAGINAGTNALARR